MTLLELLVVLLLLGLAAALVAPVLRLPAGAAGAERGEHTPDAALARAADAARALALRRGETLVLAVAADGGYTVRPAVASAADTAPLLAGRAAGGAPRRVVLSPVGTCVPDATSGDAAGGDADGVLAVWDAARCRPAAAAAAR
jgi:type II secretory pathway pseudopilin PulG